MRPLFKAKRNFRIFNDFSWYIPGVGGMFALIGLLVVGILIGAGITMGLSTFMAREYCLLISYPLQFMPAMLFCSLKSRSNAVWGEGVALVSSHFGRWNSELMPYLVSLLTLSVTFSMDSFNWWFAEFSKSSPLLGPWYDSISAVLKSMTGGPLWVSILLAVIMAPLFEEWLLRGMILRGLLEKMKPGWAIVISAALFGAIHMNPWQGIPAFVLGCFFGYVYWKTGNLWLTILMHAVNNGLSVAISNIDSLKDYEYFREFIPMTGYWTLFAFSLVIIVVAVAALRTIPVEGRSNCDHIAPAGEE
ncbi:MAG: CPBP family intramembrane metalloprotease [Bacteroidales bacterium]|nr:CPBP family intramembrane metalloprotease [Bacteroidales bacterium]